MIQFLKLESQNKVTLTKHFVFSTGIKQAKIF